MKKKPSAILISLFATVTVLVTSGCAYTFGYGKRTMPGGFKQVAIPVFSNKTKELDVEKYFTDALVREFYRSQVAEVVDRSAAPVTIEGTIKSVTYMQDSLISGDTVANTLNLPANTLLTSEYQVLITASIEVRRNSDNKIIWKGDFNDEQVYQAPQVGAPVINSVNPLYDRSAHKAVVEALAKDMMNDAHDRMTENF
jgi:Lipopolysaccharide-assembly